MLAQCLDELADAFVIADQESQISTKLLCFVDRERAVRTYGELNAIADVWLRVALNKERIRNGDF